MPFDRSLARLQPDQAGIQGRQGVKESYPGREPAGRPKVDFILVRFDQEAEVRHYAFHRIADETRTDITVGVNLALLPHYGIRIQELPLICRELLERRFEGEENRTLTLTEAEMRVHAQNLAATREESERKRRSARRPPDEHDENGRQVSAG